KHDGIAPALTFLSGVTTDVNAASYDFSTATLFSDQSSKAGWLSPSALVESSPVGTGWASVVGKRLITLGHAQDGGSFSASASSTQSKEGFALFSLTPHTQLTITFQVKVSTSILNDCGAFNCESAYASAGLSGILFSNNGQSSQDFSAALNSS